MGRLIIFLSAVAAITPVAAVVLGWMAAPFLVAIITEGRTLTIHEMPEVFFHQLMTAASFAPLGVAITIGFMAPRSVSKGLAVLLIAVLSGALMTYFLKQNFVTRFGESGGTVSLTDVAGYQVGFGESGGGVTAYLGADGSCQVGLVASLCAILYLTGSALWARAKSQAA